MGIKSDVNTGIYCLGLMVMIDQNLEETSTVVDSLRPQRSKVKLELIACIHDTGSDVKT